MCNVLKLCSSGYYKWKNRPCSKKLLLKEKIKQQITSIYFSSKQRYGSPRITSELNSLGYKISRVTVAKMRNRNFNNYKNDKRQTYKSASHFQSN
ncbi:IS3 family transposase [Chryseobacterium arthrosphaerae]|uniref:IS3 family transposase n=1 Tax=Chryseobacterium arthrosphaerae TaxID=651561 RepID=UPI003B8A9244